MSLSSDEALEYFYDWFVEVAVLLIAARLLEFIVEKLKQPKVFAWVMIGLVLPLMHYELSMVTVSLGILGIITYLFYIGLEGSLRGFLRGLRNAGLIAVGGVITSLTFPLLILPLLGINVFEAFAVGAALSATSVTLTVRTLEEFGKVRSKEGQAVLGAAVVDDVLGLALLSTLVGLTELKSEMDVLISVLEIIVLAFAFWFAVAFTIQKVAHPMYKWFSRLGEEAPALTLTFAMLLLLSFAAVQLRLSAILLAYALGLGLSSYRYMASKTESMIYPLVTLFSPLFFISAGSMLDITSLASIGFDRSLLIVIVIISLGFLTKLIGCFVPAAISGFSKKEALVIGLGMIPRAEVMMTTALAAREAGILSSESYLALILLIPISSLTVPALISVVYRRGNH